MKCGNCGLEHQRTFMTPGAGCITALRAALAASEQARAAAEQSYRDAMVRAETAERALDEERRTLDHVIGPGGCPTARREAAMRWGAWVTDLVTRLATLSDLEPMGSTLHDAASLRAYVEKVARAAQSGQAGAA